MNFLSAGILYVPKPTDLTKKAEAFPRLTDIMNLLCGLEGLICRSICDLISGIGILTDHLIAFSNYPMNKIGLAVIISASGIIKLSDIHYTRTLTVCGDRAIYLPCELVIGSRCASSAIRRNLPTPTPRAPCCSRSRSICRRTRRFACC